MRGGGSPKSKLGKSQVSGAEWREVMRSDAKKNGHEIPGEWNIKFTLVKLWTLALACTDNCSFLHWQKQVQVAPQCTSAAWRFFGEKDSMFEWLLTRVQLIATFSCISINQSHFKVSPSRPTGVGRWRVIPNIFTHIYLPLQSWTKFMCPKLLPKQLWLFCSQTIMTLLFRSSSLLHQKFTHELLNLPNSLTTVVHWWPDLSCGRMSSDPNLATKRPSSDLLQICDTPA